MVSIAIAMHQPHEGDELEPLDGTSKRVSKANITNSTPAIPCLKTKKSGGGTGACSSGKPSSAP